MPTYISTVSKTYAKEIQYEYFGEHLDGLLRSRKDDLFGIVNGIDYDVYNPMTDKNLFETYDVDGPDPQDAQQDGPAEASWACRASARCPWWPWFPVW